MRYTETHDKILTRPCYKNLGCVYLDILTHICTHWSPRLGKTLRPCFEAKCERWHLHMKNSSCLEHGFLEVVNCVSVLPRLVDPVSRMLHKHRRVQLPRDAHVGRLHRSRVWAWRRTLGLCQRPRYLRVTAQANPTFLGWLCRKRHDCKRWIHWKEGLDV